MSAFSFSPKVNNGVSSHCFSSVSLSLVSVSSMKTTFAVLFCFSVSELRFLFLFNLLCLVMPDFVKFQNGF